MEFFLVSEYYKVSTIIMIIAVIVLVVLGCGLITEPPTLPFCVEFACSLWVYS